jgi:ATP-GRASP peptide maturase of grasp-with-spasm system
MVLILSESSDVSTDCIIDWFHYYGIAFTRLSDDDLRNVLTRIIFEQGKQKVYVQIKDQEIELESIKGIWFRRAFISFASDFENSSNASAKLKQQLEQLLQRENNTLLEYLLYRISGLKILNDQRHYNANKLVALSIAQERGLHIPDTIITTCKADIAQLNRKSEDIISKPVQDIYTLHYTGSRQLQGTVMLADYGSISDTFYYSLFQGRVNKKYEIRVFYLEGEFYACCIFAKGIDGRDLLHGNKLARMVPYVLPDEIKDKLMAFMQEIKLNCGSIDLMVDVDDVHYFLEVNPVGQFGYIAKTCNYPIYKRIAKYFNHEQEVAH